jgi:hypothetical protein
MRLLRVGRLVVLLGAALALQPALIGAQTVPSDDDDLDALGWWFQAQASRSRTVVPPGAGTVNVCRWVFERATETPTGHAVVRECDYGWLKCVADPQCCMPGVCLGLPHCTTFEYVATAAEHWDEGWGWKCEDVSPSEEFERWLRQQVPTLDPAVFPGAATVVKADIDLMKLSAIAVPARVQAHVRGLLAPFVAAGTARTGSGELSAARIISEDDSTAGLYLFDDFDGITLYDLVILRAAPYAELTNATRTYAVGDILAGRAPIDYVDALLTLIHELVHVRQYSALGFDSFITNYLLESGAHFGYGKDSFEREACQFEEDVAASIANAETPRCTP